MPFDSLLPGFRLERLVSLMSESIARCQLDLSGRVVLTEAASGAYMVTPVLAAMAGARHVYALTKSTRYGTVDEITAQTMNLARKAKVQDRVEIVTEKSECIVSRADIVTNSGHVRPIEKTTVSWMRPGTVVPLMYEAWEFRDGDVDLQACAERGVICAGTNERHPLIDVFSYQGVMAAKLLMEAGVPVYGNRILLLCDNLFAPYIRSTLVGMGASVETAESLDCAPESIFDVILVALKPRDFPVMGKSEAKRIATKWPSSVVAQFWGDFDREAFSSYGIPVWPGQSPGRGHMGILPSAVGPEPIIRLQTGGLKVGEILSKPSENRSKETIDYVQALDGN